ncbi:hypothetical protein LPJ61_003483 [Coemansia biformis]|uniref:Uncharacterized protein n=1 Tax=Coemansia biformis TaxID=1286918 RepID=A0A9W8CY67_9FUNG|nr:hypothetical protein LPJ61_003483 [Coemansia biformis]
MSYVLRTRQGVLVAVGLLYVFVLAWLNRQPIPTTTLVHETDSSIRLRATGRGHLGSGNRDMHWLEPATYMAGYSTDSGADGAERPGSVLDIDAGLLYIRLHTEYRTGRPGEPLGGLLKVYRKGLGFVRPAQAGAGVAAGAGAGAGAAESAAGDSGWELLLVDRLPGPVRRSHLDRTRLRNTDGTHAPRNLAVLYYMPSNETISYRVRVYDLESLRRASFFDGAVARAGESWWDQRLGSKDAEAAIHTMSVAAALHLCPDDNTDFADAVYAGSRFSHCIGRAGLAMGFADFALPGALEVLEFSLRGSTLIYSRLNDVVRFRILQLPVAPNGTLLRDAPQEIAQTRGPEVTEYLRDIGSQSFLAQLHSTRPGGSIDVFLAHGGTTGDTFFFSFSLLQNTTLARKWVHEDVKRYRLPVHQQFSGLSRDELRLVNDPPLVEQAGLTSVFYFKATDIIVAVDTEWFRDHGSANVTQLQRVRESRPPYISTLNSPVAVNMTLDESGALLAMSTVDDELFVFSRAHASSTKRILDYRRYFRIASLLPWAATEPVSSVDALEEGEVDIFNWQLMLTWQPTTLIPMVGWEDGFISPDNPFPAAQRLVARSQQQQQQQQRHLHNHHHHHHYHQPSTTCLRFLHFDPVQLADRGASGDAEVARPSASDAAASGIVRIVSLSATGRLRMWELDSHKQRPHILWPFVTEHWGLMFILAAVVACCVYNERRWS